MKLIVGLGNPGEKYQKTRHNLGFMVVDEIARRRQASWQKEKDYYFCQFRTRSNSLVLLKSQTSMNKSGLALTKFHRDRGLTIGTFYTDFLVVHDDLDISFGNFKFSLGKGPHLHYGVQSIERELGHSDFGRLRIGIDGRDPNSRIRGEDYVLSEFTLDEMNLIQAEIFDKALTVIFDKLRISF